MGKRDVRELWLLPVGLALLVVVLLTSPGPAELGRADRYFAGDAAVQIISR